MSKGGWEREIAREKGREAGREGGKVRDGQTHGRRGREGG